MQTIYVSNKGEDKNDGLSPPPEANYSFSVGTNWLLPNVASFLSSGMLALYAPRGSPLTSFGHTLYASV